jgi:hypothetical protein
MQPTVIGWNRLTSQSKVYYSDVLLIIFLICNIRSGVYGKIDHILNGTNHRLLKKAHGIGAARNRGIPAYHGRLCPQFPIGFVNPHDHRSIFSDV